MDERMIQSQAGTEEETIEVSLRPETLSQYIGQSQVKENLKVFIEAAKAREEPLDHVLLYGPPGLGKTTLAMIIAEKWASTSHNIRSSD